MKSVLLFLFKLSTSMPEGVLHWTPVPTALTVWFIEGNKI